MHKPNFFVLALLLLSFSLVAGAQGRKPFGGGDLVERFGEALQLTIEQQTAIQQLKEQLKADLQALQEQSFGDPAQRREAVHEKMKLHRQALEALLTDEQKAILREKRDEYRPSRMERGEREKLHQELKEYRNVKILPALMEQRTKLEARISAEDKETLAGLRASVRNIHKRWQDDKDAAPRRPKERKRRGLTNSEKEEMNQLKVLVEKYGPAIETLFAEIEPQQQQWRQDLRAIGEKYRPENSGEIEKRNHQKEFHGRKTAHRAFISKRHFLLMDPDAATGPKGGIIPQSGAELNVFPNPATNNNRLQFTVREVGKVRIELRDNEGRLVKVLLDEMRDPGQYTLDVDLSGVNDGIYYYSITDRQGITTRKVVVSKM